VQAGVRSRIGLSGAQVNSVTQYKILFFNRNRLERWGTLEASDYLTAVEEAARHGKGFVVELWRNEQRLAVMRPAERPLSP
jgi:hypothetical protein